MRVRFSPLTLDALGSLKTELLCLVVFRDERPLRGAAGLIDWRLCGRLSDLLVAGTLLGEPGEALLMPPPLRRLAAERLLLCGAGERAAVELAGFRALLADVVKRALALRVRTAAFALPHASLAWLTPEHAIDALLEATADGSEALDELVIVDTDAARRAMEPRVEYARRRASAEA